METRRQKVGKRGEDEACRYLSERGHVVMQRNWRSGHLEIDIITQAPDGLHFVEVKSRTAPTTADPEVNMTGDKKSRLVRAAQAFLHSEDCLSLYWSEVFLDVVTVIFDQGRPIIEYYPQAFVPLYV